jgi:hypothetical protein
LETLMNASAQQQNASNSGRTILLPKEPEDRPNSLGVHQEVTGDAIALP